MGDVVVLVGLTLGGVAGWLYVIWQRWERFIQSYTEVGAPQWHRSHSRKLKESRSHG